MFANTLGTQMFQVKCVLSTKKTIPAKKTLKYIIRHKSNPLRRWEIYNNAPWSNELVALFLCKNVVIGVAQNVILWEPFHFLSLTTFKMIYKLDTII